MVTGDKHWLHEPRFPRRQTGSWRGGSGRGFSEMWWQQADESVWGRGREGSDRCYWSFFSDSDDSSLVASSSGGVSSYLQRRRRRKDRGGKQMFSCSAEHSTWIINCFFDWLNTCVDAVWPQRTGVSVSITRPSNDHVWTSTTEAKQRGKQNRSSFASKRKLFKDLKAAGETVSTVLYSTWISGLKCRNWWNI